MIYITPNIGKEIAVAHVMQPSLQIDSLQTFTSFTTPKDRLSRIKKAKEYRSIDIVDRILRIKNDFGPRIKKVICGSKKQQKFYDDIVLPLVRPFARKWDYEHNSLGDVFIHYEFDEAGRIPQILVVEDSEDIDITQVYGIETYRVRIPGNIRQDLSQMKLEGKLSLLPPSIQKYVNSGMKGDLILTKDEMTRTTNLKPDYVKYTDPPLMRIAEALELRKLLTDTDFVTAYGIQNEIIQFKVGDEKKPASPDRITGLRDLVKSQPPGKIMLFTMHDVQIERVGPNTDIWDQKKYNECNSRILEWAGITVTFISGQGGNYGSAVISVKPLIASIDTDKVILEEFLQDFFKLINEKNNFKEPVKIIFERNALRDHTEFMDEIKYLVGMGVYGYQDLCFIFDLDEDEQLTKKKWDDEHKDIIIPWFEPNQGLLINPNNQLKVESPPGQPGKPLGKKPDPRPTNNPRPGS